MLLKSRNRSKWPSTDWRLVRATRRQPRSQTRGPAAELCSAYWYPVYACLRRRGHRAEEAEDLTQGFFMHVLVKGLLEERMEGTEATV
jgi:RNA polymerase sigma-70 factor (ECF subfamily)